MRFSERVSRRTLDYLNVRYLVGPHHFQGLRELTREGDPAQVWENPYALPKWFSVRRVLTASDWVSDMVRVDEEGFSFKEACFSQATGKVGVYPVRRVEEVGRSPNRVELTAKGTGRAFLVSSEMAYPGWRAFAGGEEIPVEVVNHAFRGLALKDGVEEVSLRYLPLSFRLGCFLSLLVCALWSFGLARRSWRSVRA
jgi:hypothetical protein